MSLNLNQHYQNTNNEFNIFIFKTLQKNFFHHVMTSYDQIITAFLTFKVLYNEMVYFIIRRHWYIGKINFMRYQTQALSLLSDATKK